MEEPPWISGKALWLTRVLKERGVSTVHIRELVAAGSLARIRRGCYIHHSHWSGLSTGQRGIQMIYAHRLGTAAAAVAERTYSHTSAARLHGLHLWGADSFIHVTQQAALSSASHAPDGHKGIHRARKVLDLASPLSESPGGTLALHAMRVMRLPMPEQQLVVHTRHGVHRLDFGWRERKVALEFDGKAKYFDYRPTEQAIFEERRREKALMEEGWTFLRVEWRDLFDEVKLKERVLPAFARAVVHADPQPRIGP